MDVRCRFAYPARPEFPAAMRTEAKPSEFVVDVEIADLRGRPMVPAFAVDVDAVLPGIRVRHDARRTLIHDGRYWMAVAEPESGGLRCPGATEELVRETIARGYVEPAAHELDGHDGAEERRRRLVAAARLGAENLAIFADGRLYEADVVPMYEIKSGLEPCVSIVPSSAKRLERASYFRPDRPDAAEAFFRQHGGTGAFPAISTCEAVTSPDEAALWALAEAARNVVETFDDGIEEKLRDRWLERICGRAVVESLATLRKAVTVPEPSLGELVGTAARLAGAARERLHLEGTDTLARALALMEERTRAAERLMAERAPAMTDPPSGSAPPAEHAA